MKSLKLLNNKDFSIISIIFLLFFTQQSFANDPVDIWNNESVDKNKEIKNQK